jgi:AmmeMemoRadiSam system protein A/AmmeMemoRadiSam system protein B
VDVPGEWTAYQTPLGQVPIDREACDELLKSPVFSPHSGIDRGEHSLELQLPFLQRVVPEFELVPLLVGRMSQTDYTAAAEALLPLLDENTLMVASSDFTHFGPSYGYQPFRDDVPAKLQERADQAAAPLLNADIDGFVDYLTATEDTICGRSPILLLLRTLSMKGGATGVRAAVDTSGRMTGDWTNSVTYQSFVYTRRSEKLSREDRETLLWLARRTITDHLNGKEPSMEEPDDLTPALRAAGASFVTLENHGKLRGCIGNVVANGPLWKSVIQNSVKACQDFRFERNPVTAEELDDIDVEVSYLTPLNPIRNTNEIVVGRDGIVMTLGRNAGLLLPQVAYELGWTREEFLAQACLKAGLPSNAWKQGNAVIYSFQAEVFGEPADNHP